MAPDGMTEWLRRGISLGNALDTDRDEEPRLRWTAFVRSEAERLGLAWCYWDFGTDFGAFDPRQDAWRTPMLDALLPQGRRPVTP